MMGFGMGGAGMILWVILVGVVIWAVVRATGNRPETPRAGESARAILDARLARGEISVEEYKKLREALD